MNPRADTASDCSSGLCTLVMPLPLLAHQPLPFIPFHRLLAIPTSPTSLIPVSVVVVRHSRRVAPLLERKCGGRASSRYWEFAERKGATS